MELLSVERLDHLGILSEVIKDLGLIRMIDARLLPDELEAITPGEAVAGMILNSLGFSNRPMTLTPQFFSNKPLDLLFHEGVEAESSLQGSKGDVQSVQTRAYARRGVHLWL